MLKELERMLADVLGRVRSGECKVDDDLIVKIVKVCEEEADERRPLVKTEAAERLGVTTRSIDRYIKAGLLHKGRKRRGHKSLYWLKSDIDEYKEKLHKAQ